MDTTQKALVNLRVSKLKEKQAGEKHFDSDGSPPHNGTMAITALCVLSKSGHVCVGSSDNW
jgi:hypothetical protein